MCCSQFSCQSNFHLHSTHEATKFSCDDVYFCSVLSAMKPDPVAVCLFVGGSFCLFFVVVVSFAFFVFCWGGGCLFVCCVCVWFSSFVWCLFLVNGKEVAYILSFFHINLK